MFEVLLWTLIYLLVGVMLWGLGYNLVMDSIINAPRNIPYIALGLILIIIGSYIVSWVIVKTAEDLRRKLKMRKSNG